MGFGPDIFEFMVIVLIAGIGVLVPLVLVTLLFLWLVRKKRRDEMLIEQLIAIKQTLDEIREKLSRRLPPR